MDPRRDRASAAACWIAILYCFLIAFTSAQLLQSTPAPAPAATAAAAGAGAAECSLYILGGEDRIMRAGMRCTGPKPTIALPSTYMVGHTANFTGVLITRGCSGSLVNTSSCLVTICAGRVVLRRSSVSWVRGSPSLDSLLCVVGDSRAEVHRSRFSWNQARPLAVFDQSSLLMNASIMDGNSVNGSGGGMFVRDNGNVTVTGKSRVHGSNASLDGGGLFARDHAVLRVDGNSSVSSNSAGHFGGGVAAIGNASVTITGASSVLNNFAGDSGGGLAVVHGTATLTAGSRVQGNTAEKRGGGLHVSSSHVTITGGSSVQGNRAMSGSGGGLLVVHAHVIISNQSTVLDNRCFSSVGGGVAVGVRYDDNVRFDTRGVPIYSGVDGSGDFAVDDDTSCVTVINNTISNNTAVRSAGGGLAVDRKGTVELVDGTVVSRNFAVNSSGGGVVLLGNGAFRADDSVMFANNSVGRGYVGSTIAAFGNFILILPLQGPLTKCSVDVYLARSPGCEVGEVLQHDTCVCCPQSTFSFTNFSCEPCPKNAICTGGAVVQPLLGYWSSAPTSVQMHRCPWSGTACNSSGPSQTCSNGYTGPMCSVCQLPLYGMLSPFKCGKCMSTPKMQLGLYISVSGVSVLFITYSVHATWKDNLTGDIVVLATDYIKVLVQFLQYAVIIGSVSVPWPLFNLQRWLDAVNIVYAVGAGHVVSLDCWLHQYIPQGKLPLAMQRQLVYFLAVVFVLLAVVALQWLTWAVGRWVVPLVWRPKEGTTPQPALLVLRKLPVTLMVVAFYAFPTLTKASLSFFACYLIDKAPPAVQLPPGASAPLNHTAGYWVSDMTQGCFAGYHKAWALGLGLPSLLLWCIAVPVAMGVGLFLCRAKADEDSFREHFGFLYRSYRPERIWWEAVWVTRTVVLTVITVFSPHMDRYYSVLSLLVVFWVSAALQIVLEPYAFRTLHRLHMVSTSCLAATTVAALAMFGYDLEESTALQLRITIAVMVLVVHIVFVGWCLWKLVPSAKGWCVAAHSVAKSGVMWVMEAVLACAGHPKAGQGRGRGRRGGAWCCA